MKKLLIMILALTLVLGLASCKDLSDGGAGGNSDEGGNEEHTVHTDADLDGVCDGCDGIFINYDEPTIVGTVLKNSLEKQFDSIKSYKLALEACMTRESDTWEYDSYYDEELEMTVITDEAINNKDYEESIAKLEITVSVADNGVNAKIVMKTGSRDNTDDKIEYEDEQINYIIGGFTYTLNSDGYYSKEEAAPAEVVEILEKLSDAEIMDAEERDQLLTDLGVEIATVLNIKDNKGSYSFDAKPAIDELLAYFNELDMDNDTLADVIDDALAQVSADLTCEAVLTELERVLSLNVEDALDELDAWLLENHETTLQGLYDKIVNDPAVISVIEQSIASSEGLDLENEDDKAEIDEAVKIIRTFNIRKAIEDEGYDKATVFGVIAPMLPTVPENPDDPETAYVPITKDQLIGEIRAFLDMSLSEFEDMTDVTVFSTLKKYAAAFKVNKLEAKLDVNFEGALVLKSIEASAALDAEISLDSEVAGKKDFGRITVDLSITLSEMSSKEIEIALPEDGLVLFDKLELEDNTVYMYYFKSEEDDDLLANLYFYVYDEENGCDLSIDVYDVSVGELLAGEISADDYSLYVNGEYTEGIGSFVFEIDNEAGTFTVIELPQYVIEDNYIDSY